MKRFGGEPPRTLCEIVDTNAVKSRVKWSWKLASASTQEIVSIPLVALASHNTHIWDLSDSACGAYIVRRMSRTRIRSHNATFSFGSHADNDTPDVSETPDVPLPQIRIIFSVSTCVSYFILFYFFRRSRHLLRFSNFTSFC